MKKILFIAMIIALGGGLAFAQTSLQSVSPKDARSMGMGGAFRVFATGYDTFYGNPAGFASEKGSLTVADVAAWAYIKPTQENLTKAKDLYQTLSNNEDMTSEQIDYLSDWVLNNGLGAGAAVGIGWAGKGFGLGLTVVSDNVASGNSLLGATISSRTQANATIGFGIPLNLGPVRFQLGADARAYYLLKTPANGWPFYDLVTSMSSTNGDFEATMRSQYLIGGYGFAFDAGATVGFGPLALGVMVRDYGLQFNMGTDTVGNIIDNKQPPLDGTDPYILSPVVSAGASLRFNPEGRFSPSFYVEAEDPLSVFSDGIDTTWRKIHAGTEIRLLKFLALRAGLNKGWVSFGAGLDLAFIEIDAALFTEEMGINPGDFGRTGIAAEVALHF